MPLVIHVNNPQLTVPNVKILMYRPPLAGNNLKDVKDFIEKVLTVPVKMAILITDKPKIVQVYKYTKIYSQK